MGILPGLSDMFAYLSFWSIIHLRHKEFWHAIGNFNPAPYWQRLKVKSLVLFGEDDTNVPSGKSTAILRSLKNPYIEVKNYKGSGHALESPAGEGVSIIREDALEDIKTFITQ